MTASNCKKKKKEKKKRKKKGRKKKERNTCIKNLTKRMDGVNWKIMLKARIPQQVNLKN